MSTLRIHGIEAKADSSSASVNEKIKITNSSGELLFHLDGTQSGIGTVGITTTGTTFHVDRATGEITFVTDAVFNGTVGIAGTLTYEDVTNVDAVGILTARSGIRIGTGGTVGPSGSGIVTYFGDGSQLTNLPVSSEFSFGSTGITTTKNLGINTTTVDNYETVGAANSFRGIYIGDGSLIFNARLDNPNGYYIGTGRNALNAGPITLGSTMTLDGAWVIV